MFRKRDNEGLSVLQQIAMARGGDTVQADTIKAPEAEHIKAPEPTPPKHPRPRQLNGRALAETASTMGRRKRRERKRQRERELLERKEQERRGEVDRGEQRVGGNSVGGGSGKEDEEAKANQFGGNSMMMGFNPSQMMQPGADKSMDQTPQQMMLD